MGALALSACVTSPESDTRVGAGSRLEFTGVMPYARGLSVEIQMREADGSFSRLGTADVRRDNSWRANVRVPNRAWVGPCEVATFHAVASDGTDLLGFDAPCLAAAGPTPTFDQRAACTTADITVHRGGGTYTGNVTIHGQAEADAYSCFSTIAGNLSVNSANSPTVSLPALEHVTGSVDVTLNHQAFLRPDGTGQDVITGAFDVPLLTTIDGSLALINYKSPGTPSDHGYTMHFGMDALTMLGANLSLTTTFFQIHVAGLNALATIPGDFTVDWFSSADMDESTFLTALTTVGGNASLELPPNARILVPNLTDVGHDLTLTRSSSIAQIGLHMATALTSVGGNFVLDHMGAYATCGDPLFEHLESVGGTLSLLGGSINSSLGSTGAVPLEVGALSITDTGVARVPFNPDFALATGAPLTITGNTGLCQCAVDAFVTMLQGAGWTGTATSSDNGTTATCKPVCPTGCP